MAKKLQLNEDLPDWYSEYSKKVLETVKFLCKINEPASLKRIQDIAGCGKLGSHITDCLEQLERDGFIIEKDGSYVSIVL